jgi:predicted SnoaL-like aldol condensation-catalyzing enzyme
MTTSAYELRIYDIAPGQMDLIQTIFRDLVTPLMPEYGIEGVGYWATPDGTRLYWVVRHSSQDVIAANWDRFHADPRWAERLPAFERGRTVVTGTQSVPLVGVAALPPARDADNLAAALTYVDRLLNRQDLGAPDQYLAPDLAQHNPTVADGAEAERTFAREFLAAHPALTVEVKRAWAADGYVVTHSLLKTTPEDRGLAVADVFRFEHGRIAEHWDVMQPVPEATASGRPMV